MFNLLRNTFIIFIFLLLKSNDVLASCTFQDYIAPSLCASQPSNRYCKPRNQYASELYSCTDSCNSPSTRDVQTGVCNTPPIVCETGKYAPTGSTSSTQCISIPNCNSSSPVDGSFFDVVTGTCKVSSNVTLCVTGDVNSPNYFCPPINDCKPKSYICNNTPSVVSAAQSSRASEIAAIKAAADLKKPPIDNAATDAAAASAAKQAQKVAADAATIIAKAISDSVSASTSSTQAEIVAAQNDYSKALQDSINATARAGNSAAGSAAAGSAAGSAASKIDSIPSNNTGNAQAISGSLAGDLANALKGLSDAVNGTGSIPVAGSGSSDSKITCEDTKTCASTIALSTAVAGEFVDETTSKIAAKKAELTQKIASIKSELQTMFNLSVSGSSALPSVSYGTVKGVPVGFDFARFSSVFSVLGQIIMFIAAFASIRIILR